MKRMTKAAMLGTALGVTALFGGAALADDAAPAPAPMSMPAMAGPIKANPAPMSYEAGPLGKIYVTGALSGIAVVETNPFPKPLDRDFFYDVSNAQVFVQKTDGFFQFYLQGGAYSYQAIGTPEAVNKSSVADPYFDYLPQAYAKIVPSSWLSVEAGKLPTLIGDEYTFSFENMNIERGLLWFNEPAISEGAQVNLSQGPLSLSVAYTDGYYDHVVSTMSGLLSWTINSSNTLAFAASGNTITTDNTHAGLAAQNSQIYNVIFTHTSGPWTISPYFQYYVVPKNLSAKLGGALSPLSSESTLTGGALLVSYGINDHWSMGGRFEYQSENKKSIGLAYGPGSDAWSITATPTYQSGIFFARGELSYVGLSKAALGFGKLGNDSSQLRFAFETGVYF